MRLTESWPLNGTMTITIEADYIRIDSEGEKSTEWAREFWPAVVKACKENDCYRVLSLSRSTKVISIMEGFDLIELFRDLGINTKYRIAWVELNEHAIKTVRFIDAALFNRMLPGRVFETEEQAKAWLLGSSGY